MNLGCADDVKDGWVNTDSVYRPEFHDRVEIWNATAGRFWNYEDFDFVLVNHVLCTMSETDLKLVLKNCYEMLKPGGKVQIIDMDITRAFYAYRNNEPDSLPIEGGNIDYKLCMHISGYGTRKSLFTEQRMQDLLVEAGFSKAVPLMESEYDTRPAESLIVEATK